MAAERVRVREKEAGSLDSNPYEDVYKRRQNFIENQMNGKIVVTHEDREWFLTRQGKLLDYIQPDFYDDHVLQAYKVFTHDIRAHSGKHVHQGGLVIFVLEGKGHTIIDGQRYDWEAGDLILIPVKEGGVEHQHFNEDPEQGCKWVAFIYSPYWDLLAAEMTQLENSPDYRG